MTTRAVGRVMIFSPSNLSVSSEKMLAAVHLFSIAERVNLLFSTRSALIKKW
jgi:hypothetical protein